MFRHEGRYYLLDYKSNWLGEDSSAYTQQAMAAAMQAHRYDLQYQLYTWRCIVICAIALLITTMSTTLAALFICSCVALIKNIRNRDLHNPTQRRVDCPDG